MKHCFLLLFIIVCQWSLAQKPSKKDIKRAQESFEYAKRHVGGINQNPKGYDYAMYELGFALQDRQWNFPEAAILFAQCTIMNYGNKDTEKHKALGYLPYYKDVDKEKEINQVKQSLIPYLKIDSSQADIYLALAMIHMVHYIQQPEKYLPWYQKAIALGNANKTYLEAYDQIYKDLQLQYVYANLKKALETKNDTLVTSALAQLEQLEKHTDTYFGYIGFIHASFGHIAQAISYLDSIPKDNERHFGLIHNIAKFMPNPEDHFRFLYTRIYSQPRPQNLMGSNDISAELYKQARLIEKKEPVNLPYFDSLNFIHYTDTAYQFAKSGNYHSALVWYESAWYQLFDTLKNHPSIIAYHYNRLLVLGLLQHPEYEKVALSQIDSLLNKYGTNNRTIQLSQLKNKLLGKEKLNTSMLIYRPAQFQDLLAKSTEIDLAHKKTLAEDKQKQAMARASTTPKKIVPNNDPYCHVPEIDYGFIEKINKQAQNDINNWNSVTQYGQLYRESPNAKTAISRIISTYNEVSIYFGRILEQATVRKRICTDKTLYPEFDKVAAIAESMIRNAEAQKGKWAAAGNN